MSEMPLPNHDRLQELLADRALFGLDAAEERELQALLQANPQIDPHSLELTAAAVDLAAATSDGQPLPERLRRDVLAAAVKPTSAERPGPALRDRGNRSALRESLGWMAAALCAAIAVTLWWANRPAPQLTAAQQRQQLIAEAPDLVRVDWTATDDPAAKGSGGDVVWSTAKQQGFMRFHGLAANDPTKNQYQLWIFDAQQDNRYPIDGGLFDIPPGQDEVVVPIDPRLKVARPTLFAVTVEKPGGAVVSTRERLPLAAPVPGS